MRLATLGLVSVAAVGVVAPIRPGSALAQYVYPARWQSPQQQQQDHGECHVWAMQQAGKPTNSRPGMFTNQVVLEQRRCIR
jgi:hypothetical protein